MQPRGERLEILKRDREHLTPSFKLYGIMFKWVIALDNEIQTN
jgi:hypothetical protein